MEGSLQEYVHSFGNLGVYPRVYNFYRLYKDLFSRFNRVIGALPKCFHDDKLVRELECLQQEFEGGIKVQIFGKRDINDHDLVFDSGFKLQRSHETRIEIAIVSVGLKPLTEEYKQEIRSKLTAFIMGAENAKHKYFVYIRCDEFNILSIEENTLFRDSVFIPLKNYLEEIFKKQWSIIFIDPVASDLKISVSDTLETYLTDGFVHIYSKLKHLEPKNVDICLESRQVFETGSVERSLKAFLLNPRAYVEVKVNEDEKEKACSEIQNELLQALCRVVRCSLISPIAKKFGLQGWICNGLLCHLQLEDALLEAISKNTQYHFKTLAEHVFGDILDGTVYQRKTKQFYFLYYHIKSDLEPVMTNVEMKLQSLQRILTIIRKMAFETRGYLKQLNVESLLSGFEQRQKVPIELRQDLLSIRGVYGLGTVYGQLEIHVDKDTVFENDTDKGKQGERNANGTDNVHLTAVEDIPQQKDLNKLKEFRSKIFFYMKTHHFKDPYIIRYIEKKPKEIGFSFEPGDHLYQRQKEKFGTLGGFIKAKDGTVYGLTCAHVVGEKTYIDKGGPHPFSSCAKIIDRHTCNVRLKHIDIAALKVIPSLQNQCKKSLQDYNEGMAMAAVFDEHPEMIVGTPVSKYGAASGLTKGFIVSVDYSVFGADTEDYLIVIDTKPDLPGDFNENFEPLTRVHEQTLPHISSRSLDQKVQGTSSDRDAFDKCSNSENTCAYTITPGISITTDVSTHCSQSESDGNSTIVFVRNTLGIQDTDTNRSNGGFAKPGDSGSIVCIFEYKHHDCKHKALSMLSAGDLKIEGDDSLKYLSFKLSVGLQMLKETHQLDF